MANEFKIKKGLIVQGSGSTVLDIQGSQGQLFSVTDNLSGSLFSVNDISGLPILQVSSDDSVKLGTFNAEAIKVSGSNAIITGSLFGTASWATSASYAPYQVTSSYALTASYAPSYLPLTGGTIDGNVTVLGTASIAFLNVQYESASVIYSSGSNVFGDATNDIQTLNGTVLVSGSQQITGSLSVTGGITGSLQGTSSYATSASYALTASYLNSNTNAFLQNGNSFGTTALLGTNDNQSLALETSGSTRMFISSSGNVGIGTTSPGYKFHVVGDSFFTSNFSTYTPDGLFSTDARPGIWVRTPAGTAQGVRIGYRDFGSGEYVGRVGFVGSTNWSTGIANSAGTNFSIGLGNAVGTDYVTIVSGSGNVGIGTTSPTALGGSITTLEIKGANGGGIRSGVTGGSESTFYTIAAGGYLGTISNIPLNFQTNNSVKATILANGNVGIGTTIPVASLEVKGISTALQLTTSDYVVGTAGSRTIIGFGASTGNTYSRIQTTDTGGVSASDLVLQTDSGNVGIGTTAPNAKLDVSGSAIISGSFTVTPGTVREFQVRTTGVDIGNLITDRHTVTGSLNVSGSITGSLFGTSSWAISALTSSHSTNIAGVTNYIAKFTGTNTLSSSLIYDNGTAVMVGTTTPAARLTVTSAGTGTGINGTAIYAYSNGGPTIDAGAANSSSIVATNNSVNSSTLVAQNIGSGPIFSLKNNTDAVVVHVLNNGNVGVGTTTPTLGKLQVSGNVHATSFTGSLFGTASYALTSSFLNGGTNAFIQGGNSFGTTALLGTNDNQSLAIETSGSTRMFISSSGNVGIGTTSPLSKFQVRANTDQNLRVSAGTTLEINSINDADSAYTPLTFRASTYNFANGNVGIGITNPTYRLDVNGSINVTAGSAVRWGSGDADIFSSGYDLGFRTWTGAALTEKMRITSAGNTGINTTAPDTKLHIEDVTKVLTNNVAGVAQGTLSLVSTDALAADIGPSLIFGGNFITGNSTRIAYAGIAGRKANSATTNADGYLSFLTWRSTGLTEAMRITPNGDVGVGTTTPLLAVSGRGNVTINGSSESVLTLGVGDVWKGYLYSDGTNVDLSSSGSLIFGTNNATERMRINTSGDVGIGTTNINYKLSVAGNGGFISGVSIQDPSPSINGLLGLYHDSTGSSLYSNPGSNNGSSVVLRLGINYSEKMRIANNGNVGIGTTSPSERLTVSGSINTNSEGSYIGADYQAVPRLGFVKLSGAQPFLGFAQSSFDLKVSSGTTISTGNTFSSVLTVKTTGEVGIGTTLPDSKLTVGLRASTDGNIRLSAAGTGIDAGASLLWDMNVGGGNAISHLAEIRPESYATGANKNILNFYVGAWNNNADSGTTKMTITQDGTVGIGTINPLKRLDVVSSTNDSFDAIVLRPLNQTQTLSLGWEGIEASYNFIVKAGGSERMRIDIGGNVGIGTTTPTSKLHVVGDILGSTKLTIGSGHTNTGASSTIAGGVSNIASGNCSFVGGGQSNQASASYSTVGGGVINKASGSYSTVGGGENNYATGTYSTIAGGQNNQATNQYSTVAGGYDNQLTGYLSTIGGGYNNRATNQSATIAGGQSNSATGLLSTVGGGFLNKSTGEYSTIAGGNENQATGSYPTVGGGCKNLASGIFSSILGGVLNQASGQYSTVGGGVINKASGSYSTVGGGVSNQATGYISTIAGGNANCAIGYISTIAGGNSNQASGSYSIVGGGVSNQAKGECSFIGGGGSNIASGSLSGILGGLSNTVTHACSFAIGSSLTSTSGSTTYMNNATVACHLQVGGTTTMNTTTGRIDASNDVVAFATSDYRLKENIQPIKNALCKLIGVSGNTFDWKPLTQEEIQTIHGNKGRDVGVIAQEIEAILPEAVTTRDNGYKAVNYEKIIPLLIEAIKDQQKQIDELKSKL